MRIIVPSPVPECAAHMALDTEGVPHDEVLVDGDDGYTRVFCEAWDQGEPFILVEWDVIPWPGALTELAGCPRPLCAFPYPLSRGGVHDDWRDNLIMSLGCMKVTPTRGLPAYWLQTHWWSLDGNVVPVLIERYGGVHAHGPPVAHARRRGN